jgi:hypothetical protein
MSRADVRSFHLDQQQRPQFCYYSYLLRSGGAFASQLTEQVLGQVSALFEGSDRRALDILRKELSWKQTMGMMR